MFWGMSMKVIIDNIKYLFVKWRFNLTFVRQFRIIEQMRRRCPICDGEANSPHHIKPRSEGGGDEPRNIAWLCRRCHDLIEGQTLSPYLIEKMRREIKGADEVSSEEYWYIHRSDGLHFIGIKKPGKPVEPYHICFPYNAQFAMWDVRPKRQKRGRPPLVISPEARQILEQPLTVREKAAKIGISPASVHKYSKAISRNRKSLSRRN